MRRCVILLLLAFAAPAAAQEMQNIDVDFRGGKFDRKLFTFEGGSQSENYVFPEEDGLRVRFAPGNVPPRAVGFRLTKAIQGDFSFTAHYELLECDRPAGPATVGFELYVMMDTPGAANASQCDGIAFTRGMSRQFGPTLMFSWRTTVEDDKRISRDHHMQGVTDRADSGRLRLARTGDTLVASIAEADDAEFKEFRRADIGKDNVRMLRFGIPGGAGKDGRVDLRFTRVNLQATDLGTDGRFLTKPAPPAVPGAAPAPIVPVDPEDGGRWVFWSIAGLVAISLTVILLVLLLRKPKAKAPVKPLAIKPKPSRSQ